MSLDLGMTVTITRLSHPAERARWSGRRGVIVERGRTGDVLVELADPKPDEWPRRIWLKPPDVIVSCADSPQDERKDGR